MRRMARKLGKPLERIAPETLEALIAHTWPGNIRDLQNTIERAAVLARGSELVVDWDLGPSRMIQDTRLWSIGPQSVPPADPPAGNGAAAQPVTGSSGTVTRSDPSGEELQSLEAIERSHILATLRKTRGVIEGPRGAARLLEMKPSTVRFRMKKLGISKIDYLT